MAIDPRHAILGAENLHVRFNEQIVLSGASLTLCGRDHLGMVGRNGCGKSTFLRLLTGAMDPDSGQVTRRKDIRLSFLDQSLDLPQGSTVKDCIRSGAADVLDMIREFESPETGAARHEELEQQILAADGWNLDTRLETLMGHLNTPEGGRIVDQLSGGEKRRVAMCRALIAQPDLLILDEPTNHLDPESIEWLAEFLKKFNGAFLVVTHDRYFLDEVCERIIEVADGLCHQHEGNYSDYLEAKAVRMEQAENVDKKRRDYLRRELDWVRRGPKARTTKSKSRLDRFDAASQVEGPSKELDMELIIPPPPPLGNRIVELRNASCTLGERLLFEGFDFDFEAGMKIGVAGRNGLGKTSLLKMILGEIKPSAGTVKLGGATVINYVDQGRLQLNDENTVLQEASDGSESVVFGNGHLSVRAYLKRFLFTDDRLRTQVKHLSGGERSRLLLARVLKRGGNFLILDEPTNDLDLPTLRILEEALVAFPGCVLVVSHDRYFLNRVCDGILAFEGQRRIEYSVGNFDYYLEKKKRAAELRRAAMTPQGVRPQATGKPQSDAPRKLTYKEQMELDGFEERILEAEEDLQRLEDLFASPEFHRLHAAETPKLTADMEAAKKRVQDLYHRWEELEAVRHAWLAFKEGKGN